MTWSYFLVCAGLTHGPSFIFYRASKLYDNHARFMLNMIIASVVSEILKMITIATFINENADQYDIITQILLSFIDIISVAVVFMLYTFGYLTARRGDVNQNVVGVALGYIFVENIFKRSIPIWIGARNLSLDWKYLYMALESNISFFNYIIAALFCFLNCYTPGLNTSSLKKRSRKDYLDAEKEANRRSTTVTHWGTLSAISILIPSLIQHLGPIWVKHELYILGSMLLSTICFGFISYIGVQQRMKKKVD